ncbi:Odorant receptor 48 [Frankliniella occidentalis]|nr:Odorant receptor 48 [Frankliniella occidentalis]
MDKYLTEWLVHMGDRLEGTQRPTAKILQLLRESWIGGLLSLSLLMVSVAETLSPSEQPFIRRLSVRNAFPCCSSISAFIILTKRKDTILAAVRHARDAARVLCTPGETQTALTANVRWSRFLLWRLFPLYGVAVYVMVQVAMFYDTSSVNAWLRKYSEVEAFGLLKTPFEVASLACCMTSLYTVLFAELAIHNTTATLMEQLGRRLAYYRGCENTSRSVRLHVSLLAACRHANAMFGLFLPLYLLGHFALSMLSTVVAVRSSASGEVDLHALSCLPYLLVFFVPMCIAGQRVHDASYGLKDKAYAGPWLEENVQARRSRLLVMASCSRPANFTVPGVGTLDLPTCRKGFRLWFQFVQVLINLQ